MSLKANTINIRSGPSLDFPILFIYKLKFAPVKIHGKFDNWYKIEDKDGDYGWISEHLLSKLRTVITVNEIQVLYSKQNIKKAYPIAKMEKDIVLKLIKCRKDVCKVKTRGFKGWIEKSNIWGTE